MSAFRPRPGTPAIQCAYEGRKAPQRPSLRLRGAAFESLDGGLRPASDGRRREKEWSQLYQEDFLGFLTLFARFRQSDGDGCVLVADLVELVPHWPQITRVFNRAVTGTAGATELRSAIRAGLRTLALRYPHPKFGGRPPGL
jgi:hypothetical protein